MAQTAASIQREIQQQNQVVEKWRPKVRRALKRSAGQFADGKLKSMVTRGRQTEKKLARSITSTIKKMDGATEYISFSFERHGVFVHKGVGSGYGFDEVTNIGKEMEQLAKEDDLSKISELITQLEYYLNHVHINFIEE